MTSCRHFSPQLFRACTTHFQSPQAILADGGNWLIPKRKALRAIRCSKAGDGSACRTRVLSLALTFPIRDQRRANICLYAIGIGRARATPVAFRFKSERTVCKPDFANPTRTHPTTPRQFKMHPNSSCRFSYRRAGQKGTSTSSTYQSSNPKYERKSRSHFAKFGQAAFKTVFRLSGANHSCLPAVIDSR